MQELRFVLFTLEFLKHHYTQHMGRFELRDLAVVGWILPPPPASLLINSGNTMAIIRT